MPFRKTPPPAVRFHYGYIVLLFSILNLAGSLGIARFAYTLILPSMQDGLGLKISDMGLISTVGFAAYLLMSIPGGALATRFGPRTISVLSLITCGTGMVMMGRADGLWSSLLFMSVIGAGGAAGNAAGFTYPVSWFAGHHRNLAAGLALVGPGLGMVGIGLFVPSVVGSDLAEGWRLAWYCCGGATAILGVVSWFFLRNKPSDMALDPIGMDTPPYSTSEIEMASMPWTKIFGIKELWRICMLTFTFGFVYIIFGTFFGAYAIREIGLSPEYTGYLWSVGGMLTLTSGVLAGVISRLLGQSIAFVILFLCQSSSLILLALFSNTISLYISTGLYSLTLWGLPTLVTIACGDLLPQRLLPAGFGMTIFFFSLGQGISPVITGALHDLTGSFSVPFLFGALLVVPGILVSLLGRNREKMESL